MNTNNNTQPIQKETSAEKAVLGAIINFAGAYSKIPHITADCFCDNCHKDIFEAVVNLDSKGKRIDFITVTEEMKRIGSFRDGYLSYITELCSNVMTDASIEEHAAVLVDRKKRRDIIAFARELTSKAYNLKTDVCVAAEEASADLTRISCIETSDSISMSDASDMMMDRIMRAHNGELLGVPTGFPELDGHGGFCLGDLIVIGADTSVGKSALAWNIANNAAMSGVAIGYISLEMSPAQLCGRTVSQSALITSSRITNPATSGSRKLTNEELSIIKIAAKDVKQLPIFISEAANDEKVFSQIKIWALRDNVKGVFIDYLQILATMSKKFNTETEVLTHVSRRLKQLAKELNIFICVLSQLSRPQSGCKTPDLVRLRGSQEIASAADMVLLLSRPEQDGSSYPTGFEEISTHGTALIDIRKGRNVGTGKFIVMFNCEIAKFSPVIGELPLKVNDTAYSTNQLKLDSTFDF